MLIRRLTPADAAAFQALRLLGLQESPSAFSSSYEEECGRTLEFVAKRLEHNVERAVFAAFDVDELVGIIGVGVDGGRKLAHKRVVWGMYVAPSHRGRGIAKRLLHQALQFAAAMPGVRQVNLGVNVTNTAALRLYESMGFKPFGVERTALLIDGEFHDEMLMVCLLDEHVRAGNSSTVGC
jgi:RimJ/RimL family protein N-acetyltransferase